MESLENRALEILTDRTTFDLTDHEARVYLMLLRQGVMAASEISDTTNITHQRIYPVVSSLEDKGFVVPDGASRPQLYRSLSPRKALRQRILILQKEWDERQDYLMVLLREFVEITKKGFQPETKGASTGFPPFHSEELSPPLLSIIETFSNAQSYLLIGVGDLEAYKEHFHKSVIELVTDGISCELVSSNPFPDDLLADLKTTGKIGEIPENSVTFVVDDQIWILCTTLPGQNKFRFVLSTVPEQVSMNKQQLLATATKSEEETVWKALDSEEHEFQTILSEGIPPNFELKLIVAGEYMVGKTSLKNVYLGKGFQTQYMPTAGLEISSDPANEVHGLTVSIWDVAGQPSFEEVRKEYYQNAMGAMVVYDVSNHSTFEILDQWIRKIWQYSGWASGGIPIPIVVVGNKEDLRTEMDTGMITDEMARTYIKALDHEAQSKNYGFRMSYVATSAKTGMNTSAAFRLLTLRSLRWARDKGLLK